MAKRNYSYRAEILKRALDCIDRGSVIDFGRFMVLGNVRVAWTGEQEDPEEVQLFPEDDFTITGESKTEEEKAWDEINEMYSQLGADSDRADSDQAAKERTSLLNPDGPTAEDYFARADAAVKKLSPKAREEYRKLLEKLLEEEREKERLQEKPEVPADRQEGSAPAKLSYWLDLYYSRQVLAKLEKIVRRASLLDPVKTDTMSSESVEKYFAEAHRCFLYGFPIATAVLCRAMLESRLNELRYQLDPDGRIKQEIKEAPRDKPPSEYKLLIRRAAAEGLLEDSRPLLGRENNPHWAEEIISAGNAAIHDLDKFNKIYGGDNGASKVSELLVITRKAMIQLLTKQQG